MKLIPYKMPEKIVAEPDLARRLVAAEDAIARLDERARTSRLAAGWQSRLLFGEACATELMGGNLIHMEDLVLLDGGVGQGGPDPALSSAWHILGVWRKALRGNAAGLLALPRPGEDRTEARSPYRAAEGRRLPVPDHFYDAEWNETERMAQWRRVLSATREFPPVVAAAVACDAWITISPEQRGLWRAGLIAALVLKARGKTASMMLPLMTGWRFAKYRRLDQHSFGARIGGFLEWAGKAAERAQDDLDKLVVAEELLAAKLTGRRKNSRLPALVDLLLSRPLITVPMAAKALGCSPQAVEAMLGQLGSTPRELTGRGRYRAWGIV